MEVTTKWAAIKSDEPIRSLALHPNDDVLVTTSGNHLLLYNTQSGSVRQKIDGHEGSIYSVSFSPDGKRFASGGADSCVIIWNSDTGRGISKYTHSTSIQVVSFCPDNSSPDELVLFSGSCSDFGFWSSQHKGVSKIHLESKVLCCSWTKDGQSIAIGMHSGLVSLRNRSGCELAKMIRSAPIWTLCWIILSAEIGDEYIAVGCWDKTLSFYQRSGTSSNLDDLDIEFYPLHIIQYGTKSLLISGSNGKVAAYSLSSHLLHNLPLPNKDWNWSISVDSRNHVYIGDNIGRLTSSKVVYKLVYTKGRDIFAIRGYNQFDLHIHSVPNGRRVVLPLKYMITGLSSCSDVVAVGHFFNHFVDLYNVTNNADQLSCTFSRRITYSKTINATEMTGFLISSQYLCICGSGFLYRSDFNCDGTRIDIESMTVNIFDATDDNILLGLDDYSIQSYSFSAKCSWEKLKIAQMDSNITLIESNRSKSMILVLCEDKSLYLYNGGWNQEIMRKETVKSFAFNETNENMFCLYSESKIHIYLVDKELCCFLAESIHVHSIANFFGSAFCYINSVDWTFQTFYLSTSCAIEKCISHNDFEIAFQVACSMETSEKGWNFLGNKAMRAFEFKIAKKALGRAGDLRFHGYLDVWQSQLEMCSNNIQSQQRLRSQLQGEICAMQGNYEKAADFYLEAGKAEKAVELYVDLKKWEKAKHYARSCEHNLYKDIVKSEAKWLKETSNDWKEASRLYIECGLPNHAAQVLSEALEHLSDTDSLCHHMVQIANDLPKSETKALRILAQTLMRMNQTHHVKSIYQKLDDGPELMRLSISSCDWANAARYMNDYGNLFDAKLLTYYCESLIMDDMFEEAILLYRKMGMNVQNKALILQLAENAITECRYRDASYFFWTMCIELQQTHAGSDAAVNKVEELKDTFLKAKLYFAYQQIFDYCNDPFTSVRPDVLFNLSYYVASLVDHVQTYRGISLINVFYTLAKQAKSAKAFKLAKSVYRFLQDFHLPDKWRRVIDMDTLKIYAKSNEDDPDLNNICYRCGSSNVLFTLFHANRSHERCTNCGHPFVRCFINFDVLPLVEFFVDKSLSLDNIFQLLHESSYERKKDDSLGEDEFNRIINDSLQTQVKPGSYKPITITSEILRSMNSQQVFVCKPLLPGEPVKLYKNMIPEIAIVLSPCCNLFFHAEDFEFACLRDKCCPFSRKKIKYNSGSYNVEAEQYLVS